MNPYQETIITDTNARYYGIDITELMNTAGKGIAEILVNKYGEDKSYAFVCGLGNNGGDGISAARYLKQLGVSKVKVYLVGRQGDIATPAAKEHWEQLVRSGVEYKQDAFGKDIEKADVIIECLLGTGIRGKLYKRFNDVIYRITRLKSQLVAIDVPVPGYKWHLSISLMYPKTEDAHVIDLNLPDNVLNNTGPGEVKLIEEPKKHSYKSQNGKVLIIGGSEKFHGAPVLATKAAANFAGLVYLYSPVKDKNLIAKMSASSNEFISVEDENLSDILETVDAILLGPGLEENLPNKALVNYILKKYPTKKYVIDAGALGQVDLDLIKASGNVILTPHRGEVTKLFAEQTNIEGKLKRYVKENNCYVNLKSSTSILFGKEGQFKFNTSGNAGMAKGGSGDALAGLTVAFAAKNDLWLAMTAAAFVNGIASDLAKQEHGYAFSAEELIKYQQKAFKLCKEF